jgi:hypothetical protein
MNFFHAHLSGSDLQLHEHGQWDKQTDQHWVSELQSHEQGEWDKQSDQQLIKSEHDSRLGDHWCTEFSRHQLHTDAILINPQEQED